MEPPPEPPSGLLRSSPRKRGRDAEDTQRGLLVGHESSPDSVGEEAESGLRALNLIDLVGKSEGRKDDEGEQVAVEEEGRVLDLIGRVGEDTRGKGIMEVEEEQEQGRRDDKEGGRVGEDRQRKGLLDVLAEVAEEALRVEEDAKRRREEDAERRREEMKNRARDLRKQTFRNVAKSLAPELAHFVPENADLSGDARDPPPLAEPENRAEDRPGPFSAALKIIRERANTVNISPQAGIFRKGKSGTVVWKPKERTDDNRPRKRVPSLQDLCLSVLAKNSESIVSLQGIPYSLRHRLSNLLCDSRRMSKHFLDLLVQGSPTEIRLKDCSWLTEEDFTECFQACDTSNLMVLQLDKCGRCIADYTILPTIAQSPHRLPVLTTLSLSGACRLSDAALKSLVSATPALRSINLSQCSLLTSASINAVANALGPVLQELYIDDCEGIDPMLILPGLKKIERLEVLSLAGIQTVRDVFIKWLVAARGNNMKELVLSNCVELTDSSLKEIANSCPGLRLLDLVNLRKLTDAALEYVANGCQQIQTLKLSRNPFSDEAIAAFLETSGKLLKELSLNNVKVGVNTAWALSKCGSCLSRLDLSWCRSLTDEEMGLIVDNCLSLRVLKLFGCTQITRIFIDGHSNPDVQIIGLPLSPILHIGMPEQQDSVLRYSAV